MSKHETMEVFGTELVIGAGTDSARVVCKAAWGGVTNAPLFDVFRSTREERIQVTADLDRIAACYNALAGLNPSAVATLIETCERLEIALCGLGISNKDDPIEWHKAQGEFLRTAFGVKDALTAIKGPPNDCPGQVGGDEMKYIHKCNMVFKKDRRSDRWFEWSGDFDTREEAQEWVDKQINKSELRVGNIVYDMSGETK
jgi:hypothetical protein